MRLIGVKLSVISAIAVVALSYTNCSKVDFEVADLEGTAQALGFKDGSLILINEGAEYTNSVDVSLRLEHNDAEEMMISDRADCSGGVWEPMARKKSWKLSSQNNNIQVFARFRRLHGERWIESGCVMDAIIHDNIAPEIAIVRQPGSLFNNANQSIEVRVTDSGSGVGSIACDATWSTGCSQGVRLHTLTEGAHAIRLSAVDRAGNAAPEVSDALSIDLTAPIVKFTSTPATITADPVGKFSFSAVDAMSGVSGYECSADGAVFAACSSGISSTYGAGGHSFRVRATDGAGNVSAPIAYSWNIDLSAPSVTIKSGPEGNVKSRDAHFTFEGSDDGIPLSSFICKLDGRPAAQCDSGSATYTGLSDGEHTFTVIAKDGVGHESSPATRKFVIDTMPPSITIEGPTGRQASSSAAYTFTASDSGSGVARIECAMDSASFSTCGGAKSFSNLSNGSHTISARAIDNVGNTSMVASKTIFVDLIKPIVVITKSPASEIAVTTADYEFSASDADGGSIAHIECRLNASAWEKCTSPKKYEDLAKGDYKFEVRATDSVGLVSDIKSHQFKVAIPDPVVICDPFGSTTNTKAGIAAKLAYYDGPDAYGHIKNVEDVWTKGTKVEDTVILFGQISVPTRSFDQGFEIGGGKKLTNSRGEDLIEWFSLEYNAEIKLDDGDSTGLYQFATLSDDGSILMLDSGSGFQKVVDNDGHTPTRMKCGGTVQMSRASRIPMKLKYFQGPRTEIAVTLLWRKVGSGNDYGCDVASNWFNGSGQGTNQYNQMMAQGWKVMGVNNFQMTEVIPNVCKDK
ncbi:MAG: hypothetical protein KF767_16675 [Bdellovibrionaceae bacterium]|nr:hypothetical protein [Pseudobdellovibrionaceae bacterium]